MLKRNLPIESQLYLFQVFGIIVTAVLCLVLTISVTLTRNNYQQEKHLLEECSILANSRNVRKALAGEGQEHISNYLDIYIKSIENLDFVAVCNTDSVCLYYPNKAFVGRTVQFGGEDRVLVGEGAYIVTVERTGYGLEMAYAPVLGDSGNLLGYVVLSVFLRSPDEDVQHLLYLYVAISFGTAFLGIFISISARRRTLKVLQGRRVEEYRRLTDERTEVLDALDEAIVAINLRGEVIMINRAFLRMLGYPNDDLLHYEGKLEDIYPETQLPHLLETGTAQYNVSVRIRGQDYVSSCIPVYEDGQMIGAASISRNVTEVRRLGQELSGANQMVDTLRSFNHEYNNKLHVILGYLEQQHPNKAKDFIIHTVGAIPATIGKVTKEIESTGIAAIIIGKMVEASKSGIKLDLQADSSCTDLTEGIPLDCYVTVLGNLLQNAIDELRESGRKAKEIGLGLFIDKPYTILTITDNGRGMSEEVRGRIFEKGLSTKGEGRGMGLFLVRELVNQYQGTIEVETEDGVGTSITVSFRCRSKEEDGPCTE